MDRNSDKSVCRLNASKRSKWCSFPMFLADVAGKGTDGNDNTPAHVLPCNRELLAATHGGLCRCGLADLGRDLRRREQLFLAEVGFQVSEGFSVEHWANLVGLTVRNRT